MLRVVVGVDGSGRSKQALRRAFREATLREGRLEAVHVFNPDERDFAERLTGPLTKAWKPDGVAEIFATVDAPRADSGEEHFKQARDHAVRLLAAATRDALGEEDTRSVRGVVLPGTEPANALLQHAEGADLLVIGIRQRSPVGKLILGSDARDIILASPVPVLTVANEG